MATTNIELTKEWTLVVASGDEFILSPLDAAIIEVATSDTEIEPTVARGHVISPGEREAINRAVIGPGVVYARVYDRDSRVPSAVAVSAWST